MNSHDILIYIGCVIDLCIIIYVPVWQIKQNKKDEQDEQDQSTDKEK
jgi:hypothetical protein